MNLLTAKFLWNCLGRAAVTVTLMASLTVTETPPDLYIMAMTYQPEFCFQHRSNNFVGCLHPMDYWKTHLTIHGLWPEYKDGTWPSSCTREPLSKEVVEELKDALDVYWPNVEEPETSPAHVHFWQHEWSKHGTCSGLDQNTYFRSALGHSLPTPDMVQYGSTVDKSALVDAYGGADRVVAVCSKGRFLSEVRTCLSVGEEDGAPKEQIPCPNKVLEENNCGDSIVISKFPSSPQKEKTSRLRTVPS